MERLRGQTDRAVGDEPPLSRFESRSSYLTNGMIHLSLRSISFGCRSNHLVYRVIKSGCKIATVLISYDLPHPFNVSSRVLTSLLPQLPILTYFISIAKISAYDKLNVS